MTVTALPEIEIDETRLAHRKACAYLKGFVVGYGVSHGMKWDGDPDRIPEFREFREGWDKAYERWWTSGTVTGVHVLYNRIRHNRPHLGSVERDVAFLGGFRGSVSVTIRKVFDGFGFDVKEVLT